MNIVYIYLFILYKTFERKYIYNKKNLCVNFVFIAYLKHLKFIVCISFLPLPLCVYVFMIEKTEIDAGLVLT